MKKIFKLLSFLLMLALAMPAGLLVLPEQAFAATVTYGTPGTYTFTIPSYSSMTVSVYGAGGGGDGGDQVTAVDGGYSAFDDGGAHPVLGNGGNGVNGSSPTDTDCASAAYGAGGTASGGDTNTSGSNGGEYGGSYLQSLAPTCKNPGGWGGANHGPSGGAQRNAPVVTAAGLPGNSYGGGGSGVDTEDYPVTGYDMQSSGGGGGGYASKTFSSGVYTPGNTVTVTVGTGGAGGSDNGYGTGGTGANGAVVITYTAPNSPPAVTTSAASSITTSSATLNGSITDTGGANATQTGFAFSTNATLSSGVSTSTLGGFTGTGSFSDSSLSSSLSTFTTYYYRAYATNTNGTGYGSIMSFTTQQGPTRKMRLFEGFKITLVSGTLKLNQSQ